MFRDGQPMIWQNHCHFLMPHAALGDLITSLPAVVYARKNVSLDEGMTVWVPEHQLPLVKHLIGGPGLDIRPLHEWKNKTSEKAQAGPGVLNAIPSNVVTRNKMDMVTFGFVSQLDTTPPTVADMNYPHWAPLVNNNLPEFIPSNPYVVISTGATSDNKIFHPKVAAEVIRSIRALGYEVVVLGKATTHVKAAGENIPLQVRDIFERLPKDVQAACVDARDKTDLITARSIIGNAACMIGVDGGLLHLAGTTDVPIVYGLTSVDPDDRGITRHDQYNWRVRHVTPRDLACSGCQSHWILAFGQDFRHCAYNDNKCTESLYPEDFVNAFRELMEEKDNAVA